MENNTVQKENILFGIIGAFLFSLVGGVAYYLIYQVGFIAGISGLIGVVCAIKGYEFFAKSISSKGVVISIVMAALTLIAAWYICLTQDVYNACIAWQQEGLIDSVPSFFDCITFSYEFLADVPEYYTDLAISLVLAVVGSASYLTKIFKEKKAQRYNADAYNVQNPNDAQDNVSAEDALADNGQNTL